MQAVRRALFRFLLEQACQISFRQYAQSSDRPGRITPSNSRPFTSSGVIRKTPPDGSAWFRRITGGASSPRSSSILSRLRLFPQITAVRPFSCSAALIRLLSLITYSSLDAQAIFTGAVPGLCTDAVRIRFSRGSSRVKISVISGDDR